MRREVPWRQVFAYLLASALCAAMVLYRAGVTGRIAYAWLVVPNLVLAWMPFGFSLAIHLMKAMGWRSRLVFGAAGALWLAFFPNAPYIVTDLVHLTYIRDAIPIYFDIALVALAAWTGLGLGFSSLMILQEMVAESLGRWAGWGFAVVAWVLGSIGVYLGRVERWNSWDLLRSPMAIIADTIGALSGEALLMMATYAVVPMTLYLAFCAVRGPRTRG